MSAYDPIPFWPSRRLWLKFFIGLIYVPLLFSLLIWVFVRGLFSPSSDQALYIIPFVLILIGGPVSIGVLLLPSWRGIGVGILALVVMILTWNISGNLFYGVPYLNESFSALTAISGILVFEFATEGVNQRGRLAGLGIGVLLGYLLSLLFANRFSPYDAKINLPKRYDDVFFIVGWSISFALVWSSAFMFSEFSRRQVGWGGVLIWATTTVVIFGLSAAIMQ